MAQIDKPNLHFNTKLYTGNGSTNAITGVGFQPDWVWIKKRDGTSNHQLFDAVRGVTKFLESSATSPDQTDTNSLTAFGTDGFTLGSSGGENSNGNTFVSWNWKANGAGSSNTDGDITSTVSANQTAGFSIVKYTGNGSNDQRVGHGLGARPTAWFIKRLGSADDWIVYHQGLATNWYDDTYLYLNSTNAVMGAVNAGTGNPTSSVFYIGDTGRTGASGDDYIAYVFAEKKGFSKFGSYKGNGNADGTFVYTGFKPSFILRKCTTSSTAENWVINDNKRDVDNVSQLALFPNNSNVEDTATHNAIDICSNGFKVRTSDGRTNGNNNNYIYMAFAENPIVGSNNIPATAR